MIWFRLAVLLSPLVCASNAWAQQAQTYDSAAETQAAIRTAQAQATEAKARGERLEAEANRAGQDADRTRDAAAALAARIQQAEAEMAVQEAKAREIEGQRSQLRAELARQQRPLMQLTAALQRLSRHSMMLAMLRPGTLHDAAHSRALLASLMPEVQRRTAGLRSRINHAHALAEQARQSSLVLAGQSRDLAAKHQALAAQETQQRLAARGVSDNADRETEQAIALSEKARDLSGLMSELTKAGELREQLAQLPGPILRPARPEAAQTEVVVAPEATPPVALGAYMLPISGQLVSGFGDARKGQTVSRGIAIAARAGALAVAPGPGRVAFAGPYRGFGVIVIVEHAGGWTSLITGLAQLDARVGEVVRAGSPIGTAGSGKPLVMLELRRGASPVNPLDYISTK